jgi:cytochrome b subunit of formate dehydrogenase
VYAENAGGNYSTTNSVTVVATNVLLTTHFVAAGVIAPSGVVITGVQMTAGGLQFNLQITGAVSGSIQASANLINWAAVTNFAGTNTTLHFRDPGATNAGARFYRVEGE